ncbi:MAG: M28 family metallopeptidase [Acidobacteria bacterium]|nr:M28 family metallopeptidase [Acidobacteriota bacterium]
MTDSANVVGILQGEGSGAILLGAHHDSRNACCPGASDDASGVAVLLETARRLARSPHRHTLVFASFTGEESLGLPGSRQFLASWKGPPLLAAITLDFVGTGQVFVAPFPRPPELWASRLLARAEAEAMTGRVLFDPWLVIVPRLLPLPYGADHASFLEAGVPAFNLSCQFPAWTYHTSEDVASRIDKDTLFASLELVARMIRILDEGSTPTADAASEYLPLPIGGSALFAPGWMLRAAGAILVFLAVCQLLRHWREVLRPAAWVEAIWVLLAAIPFTALAVSGGFAMESLLGFLAGVRHPWSAHPTSHLAGGLLAMSATSWLATGVFRFVRPSTRPGPYLTMAVLLQMVLAGSLAALGRHDIAFGFWLGAAGMLAASFCVSPIRRLAWGILGVVWTLPILSATAYRMFLELSGASLPPLTLEGVALAVALPWFLFIEHLLCLPEVLLDRRPPRLWSPAVGGCLLAVTAGAALLNATRPSYDSNHRAVVEVRETVDMARKRVEASFSSSESLNEVRAEGWNPAPLPDALWTQITIGWERIQPPDLQVDSEEGLGETVLRLHGSLLGSPRITSLMVRGDHPFQVMRGGVWEETKKYRRVNLPNAREIHEEIRIRRSDGDRLEYEGEVSGDDDLLGLNPRAADRVFRFSSKVRLAGRLP